MDGRPRTQVLRRRGTLQRLTYATVVWMSVLAVVEDTADVTWWTGVAVVVAPVLALTVAHFFAEALQQHADLGRPLTTAEWAACVRDQGDDLLAAVPPVAVLVVAWIAGFDEEATIAFVLWLGAGILVALAAVAAFLAGIRSWRLVVVALAGGVVGLIVIALQILLKPH